MGLAWLGLAWQAVLESVIHMENTKETTRTKGTTVRYKLFVFSSFKLTFRNNPYARACILVHATTYRRLQIGRDGRPIRSLRYHNFYENTDPKVYLNYTVVLWAGVIVWWLRRAPVTQELSRWFPTLLVGFQRNPPIIIQYWECLRDREVACSASDVVSARVSNHVPADSLHIVLKMLSLFVYFILYIKIFISRPNVDKS